MLLGLVENNHLSTSGYASGLIALITAEAASAAAVAVVVAIEI